MTRTLLVFAASATLVACSAGSSDKTDPPNPPPSTTPSQVTLPSIKSGMASQLYAGQITLTSDTGPGTASFVGATSFDGGTRVNPTFGSGSFSLTFSSATYAQSQAQSAFVQASDDSGNAYLLIAAFAQPDAATGQSITVAVPMSAFAAGATVALDGQTTFAAFGAGPIDQPEPTFFAVATTGSVTFGANSSLTGTIDATLNATFAVAQLPTDPTPPEPRSPDGGVPPVAPPTAGTYTLTADGPAISDCEGTLAGSVNDFNALVASTWFADTSITVSVANGVPTATANGFAALFGQGSLSLTSDEGSPWVFEGTPATVSTVGPDGTTLVDVAFWVSDGGDGLGLLFQPSGTNDGSSYCSVSFAYDVSP
jgi:hypothetical protein